jgi:hypothetical protein
MRSLRVAQALAAVLALAALAAARPAAAQDSVVRIYDSTLDKLAATVQPITVRGRHRASIFVFGLELTLCDSAYAATVSGLRFATTPASIQISGRVDATWCGLAFRAPLATTADVSYSAPQRAIVVRVAPTSVEPRFVLLGVELPLPVRLDVGPTLSVPPVPVGVAQVGFQGVHGPVTLRFEPRNAAIARRSGHLEVRSDFTVW